MGSPERTRAPARPTGARRRPHYTDPDLMTTGLREGIRSHEATHPTNAPSKLGFKISRKQLITGFSVLATVMVFSLCCCTDHGKQAIRRLLARNSENPQLLRSPAFTDVMVYDKKMRCVRLDRRRLNPFAARDQWGNYYCPLFTHLTHTQKANRKSRLRTEKLEKKAANREKKYAKAVAKQAKKDAKAAAKQAKKDEKAAANNIDNSPGSSPDSSYFRS